MFAITGATGQLGRLVIDALLRTVPADRIVAAVRSPSKAADLSALGVVVREADYDRPDTLAAAFQGVEKLLLISSNEVGRRKAQHQAVIDAARTAGVRFIAYTSILRAPTSPIGLAEEHRQTEAALGASGVAHALLRNGWYTENFLGIIPAALAQGSFVGAAGQGRIAAASRADYAEAAAAALIRDDQNGAVWELAGEPAWTLADLASEVSRQTDRTIAYRDLSEADYAASLLQAGLPEPIALMLADSEAAAANGALDGSSDDLHRLIGRPSTPLSDSVAHALKG